MAELSVCCSDTVAATCCEPESKDECCGTDSHAPGVCGCDEGDRKRTTELQATVRQDHAAVARSIDPGRGAIRAIKAG